MNEYTLNKILVDFLNWMNKTASETPMRLETDHDDIAMMFVEESNILESINKSDNEFIDYLKSERNNFIVEINKQDWNAELREKAESLIIAFDQAIDKIIGS